MNVLELFSFVVALLFVLCAFVSIIMVFILGRTRMKDVDRFVYGSTFEHDTIFSLLMRFPQYATVFAFRWHAKRSRQLALYNHFDKKFKRPFIIASILAVTGGVFLTVGVIMDKYFL